MIILALVGSQGSVAGSSKKKKRDAGELDREAVLPLAMQCLVALLRLCVTLEQLRRVFACLPTAADADVAPGARAYRCAAIACQDGQIVAASCLPSLDMRVSRTAI